MGSGVREGVQGAEPSLGADGVRSGAGIRVWKFCRIYVGEVQGSRCTPLKKECATGAGIEVRKNIPL